MDKDITIIICTYNGAERLPRVISKIYEQRALEKYVKEIIVVDNHSTDETSRIIHEIINIGGDVPLRYVYEEEAGLSNARKRGVDNCSTEWIAFLDDDNFVEENWIECMYKYIVDNPNIGAFNGAVIPAIPFDITEDERKNLKASLKVLACTHYDINELKSNPGSPFRNPIGAGMLIRTAPLIELSGKGWLSSGGRKKDSLSSGEDGEMAFFVKSKGYDFGFCPNAILYHEMSRRRLEYDYLDRMWYEIGRGVAIVAKRQNSNQLTLSAYKLLLRIRFVTYFVTNPVKGKFYLRYIEGFSHEL